MSQRLPFRSRAWTAPAQEARAQLIRQGLHPVLAGCLATRGVADADALDTSLIRLHPPTSMASLPEAGLAIAQAIASGQRILVVGDYDADGATATAVLLLGLGRLGAQIDFVVPDRFRFGYGLTPALLHHTLAEPGRERPDWIITVDNGISAHAGVAAAQDLGLSVLVTDHHLPGKTLPDCLVVNPQVAGCGFPSKCLAGVGVAFYLVMAVRAQLAKDDLARKAAGDAPRFSGDMPRIDDLLPLVALGTVADLVRLDDNNRRLVDQGLKRIRKGVCPPGITALFQLGGRDPAQASARDLGFTLGPRLNAAGRVTDMTIGIRCLSSTDPEQALAMAQSLESLNQTRKGLQQAGQEAAMAEVESALAQLEGEQADPADPGTDRQTQSPARPLGFVLYRDSFHQGVVGLVAGRIKDRHHRPTVVFAPDEDGLRLKGSARSIPGVHIRDVLERIHTQQPGLIQAFGGHDMAAGLTIAVEGLALFRDAFLQALANFVQPEHLEAFLLTDGELPPQALGLETCDALSDQVWGQGFPPPLFEGRFLVREQRWLKDRHLKLVLAPEHQPSLRLEAIWFFAPEDLQTTPPGPNQPLHLAYELSANEWQGRRSLQLMVRAQATPSESLLASAPSLGSAPLQASGQPPAAA